MIFDSNNLKTRKFAVLVLSVITIAAQGQFCYASQRRPHTPLGDEIDRRLHSDWHASRSCTRATSIEFDVTEDGKVQKPFISMYSGDDQFDAECLEAVCGLSPLNVQRNQTAKFVHIVRQFGEQGEPSFGRGLEASDIKGYLQNNFQPRIVVVHRIPLSVLRRYPDFFKESELVNQNNLLEIKAETDPPADRWINRSYVSSITNLYSYWNILFAQKNVTRQAILNYSKGAERAIKKMEGD